MSTHNDIVQEPAETYGDQLKRLIVKDERVRQFIMVDYAVLDVLPQIKRNGLAVYCVLLRFANRQSRLAWPKWETLQRLTGLGRDSVRRGLRDLETAELIETVQLRAKGEFSSNAYRLIDLTTKNTVSDNMDVEELDVQFLDVQKLVNNLDPDLSLSRSRSKLERKDTERAREELQSTEAEDKETCISCGEWLNLCSCWVEENAPPHVPPSPPQRARDPEPPVPDWQKMPRAPHHPPVNMLLADNPGCAAHPDPTFPCQHERAALAVLPDILGYTPAQSHRHLHAFVHRHSLADVVLVATRYTETTPDRTQWKLGFIFAPDNAEALLSAVKHPPPAAPTTPARPEDRVIRPGANKVFDRDEPAPQWEEPPEDAKQAIADLHAKFNERGME